MYLVIIIFSLKFLLGCGFVGDLLCRVLSFPSLVKIVFFFVVFFFLSSLPLFNLLERVFLFLFFSMSRGHRSDRRERRRGSRDRDHKRKRDRSREHEHERTRRRKSEHRHRGGNNDKSNLPRDFHCHLCGKNHWTVDCERLKQHPGNYPMLDAVRGCWQCGQRGHNASQCRTKKYLCPDCGVMHDTRDCVYSHVGEDWYEFYDPLTRHVYYVNADESQVQWSPPTHQLDTVYWYCPHCKIMIPSKHRECLQCHVIRPESKEQAAYPTDSDSDSDISSSSSSSSSTSSTSSTSSIQSSSSSSSGWSSVSSSSDEADSDNDGDLAHQSASKKVNT